MLQPATVPKIRVVMLSGAGPASDDRLSEIVRMPTVYRFTPVDTLAGRRDEILERRREVKDRTINRLRLSNHALREQLATP